MCKKKFVKFICLLVIAISAMCLLSSCRPSQALTDAYYDSVFNEMFNHNNNDEQGQEVTELDETVPDDIPNDKGNGNHFRGGNNRRNSFWDMNNSEDWIAI